MQEQKRKIIRTCILTKNELEQNEMIRFVLSPDDGVLYPDLDCKLEGRGCYLTIGKNILLAALNKKAFNKAFKTVVKIKNNEDLIINIENLLKNKLLKSLGLAKKAGVLISGFEKVKECLQKQKAVLYLSANDTADNSKEKIEKYLNNIKIINNPLTINELGDALGLNLAAHIVINDINFANNIIYQTNRLKQFKEN